jgi:DNA topoisomerase-1
MAPAIFDSVKVDIKANNYTFRANGQTLKFEGFLKVYPSKFEENELPVLEKDEALELIKLIPLQHFTQPPARYTEATLIKALEENGIGRPSTYAPIISTVQTRNYIEKDERRRLHPTEIGTVVNNLLVEHFPDIVDIGFTAKMEDDLDEVANGKKKWAPVIKEFYEPFEKNLKKKEKEVPDKKTTYEKTDKKCPKCGGEIIIRLGRYGKFYSCSNFPKCKHTEALKKNTLGIKCPKCKKGDIVIKRTKRKKIFYGCSNWPDCNFATWDEPTGKICEKCKSPLVKTKKGEVKCSNKDCQSNKKM